MKEGKKMKENKDYASMEIWELARLSQDDGDVIIIDDANQYSFASNGSIPEGKYHSVVSFVEKTKTNSGDPAYDIGYTLTPLYAYINAINAGSLNELDDDKYYLRVRYKTSSDSYRKYTEAMYIAGLPAKFKPSDTVGVEEVILLEYPSNGGLANIEKRQPLANCVETTSDKYENDED